VSAAAPSRSAQGRWIGVAVAVVALVVLQVVAASLGFWVALVLDVAVLAGVAVALLVWRGRARAAAAPEVPSEGEQGHEELARRGAAPAVPRRVDEASRAAVEQAEHALIDALVDGVVLYGADGTILRTNASARALLGEDPTGRHAGSGEWRLVDIEGRAIPTEEFPSMVALRTGENIDDAVVGLVRAHTVTWLRVSARTLRGGPAVAPRLVLSMRDISDGVRNVDELDRARAEAERANVAKTEFMRRLHHELRTPLNAVFTAAQLLDERDLPEDQRRIAARILKGCRLALGLMEDLREISLIEEGQLRLRHDATDVAEVISDAVDAVDYLRAPNRIALHVEPVPPGLRAWADPKRLTQVLVNLLTNAVKYNRPDGSVWVRAVALDERRVRIEVEDTGRGIAPQDQRRVFDPFERLDAARTGVDGTGLGLSISQRLIETMDGHLGLESTPGRGSTFSVELARAPSAEPAEPDLELVGLGGASTVLYIEDNPDNVELMCELFERWPSLQVLPAMTGGAGLELAAEAQPALILLDLHLPDLHGLEVLGALRADPATRDIPVIMVTADATGWEHEVPAAERPDAIVTKPIDVRSFRALIEEWIGTGATRADPSS